MNTKKLLFAIAMTLVALPLAAQDDQLSKPIKIVGAKQIARSCHMDPVWGARLTRADVAKGFDRAWTDEMEPLRAKANDEARQVCRQGEYDGVSFTFVRGSGERNLSISAGNQPIVASATP
ncbi:MAG: hypothetical protein JSR63_03085 [Proteobacteria bacterium]|nr:hypothetical protein [Pseudomonadota bacterium]MBS0217148.1 hypothetical protein [Pseudomonadota bacterium]